MTTAVRSKRDLLPNTNCGAGTSEIVVDEPRRPAFDHLLRAAGLIAAGVSAQPAVAAAAWWK
ncbi:hypothetical protein [Bradyrhizobium sp. STM 3561]|uniref:hypothetical protein n=1 Tax=Bradyrhizobium sp. STM 3561 TaxID=578923 RepID=UPI00388E0FEC